MHDIHNDYPLAPEKNNIPKKWLSGYSLEFANAHNITTGTVKNLMNKNNYVIHYRNLFRVRNEIKENTQSIKI